jgi:hypothetical protein
VQRHALLRDELLRLRRDQLDTRPLSEVEAYDMAAAEAAETRVAHRAIDVGDRAPEIPYRPPSHTEPLVLTWYLSGWSAFCRAALGALERARLVHILVLTPEPADRAAETGSTFAPSLEIRHDDGEIAKKFGICYRSPPAFAELLGLETGSLPAAACYIIEPDRTVSYAFVHPDARYRAEPAELARRLRARHNGEHGR